MADAGVTADPAVYLFEWSTDGSAELVVRHPLPFSDTDLPDAERRPSIIQFRCEPHRSEQQLEFLLEETGHLEESCRQGCVVTVTDGRIRIRSLPIQP